MLAYKCHLHTLFYFILWNAICFTYHKKTLAQNKCFFTMCSGYIDLSLLGSRIVCFRQTETAIYTSRTPILMVLRFIRSISRESRCIDMTLTVNTSSVWATDMLHFHRATTICKPSGLVLLLTKSLKLNVKRPTPRKQDSSTSPRKHSRTALEIHFQTATVKHSLSHQRPHQSYPEKENHSTLYILPLPLPQDNLVQIR